MIAPKETRVGFTPYPWRAVAESGKVVLYGQRQVTPFRIPEAERIAVLDSQVGSPNTRLLAAAPELYEMLRQGIVLAMQGGDTSDWAIWYDDAQVVLAAVEGRTP